MSEEEAEEIIDDLRTQLAEAESQISSLEEERDEMHGALEDIERLVRKWA